MKYFPLQILLKNVKKRGILVFFAIVTTTATQAAVLTISPGESAVIFQYLSGGTPNAVTLNVGEDVNGYTYRSLISFDLSSIPENAVITSASLSLPTKVFRNWPVVSISIHRVTESWVNAAGNVSWSKRDASTNWSTTGGSYASSASSTLTGAYAVANQENHFTGLEDDVQLWLDNPSQNFGWILINSNQDDVNTFKSFYGNYDPNYPNSGSPTWFPPVLTIEYEVIPEASGVILSLLGAGCIVYFRRRPRFKG